MEFRFAEITLDAALSNKHVDALIGIIRTLMDHEEPFEIKNHVDLKDLWTSAAGLHGLAPVRVVFVSWFYWGCLLITFW